MNVSKDELATVEARRGAAADARQQLARELREAWFNEALRIGGNPAPWSMYERDARMQAEWGAVADAALALVAAEREACARIADGWAHSKSCVPGEACEHQRTAAAIAEKIRQRAEAASVSEPRGSASA